MKGVQNPSPEKGAGWLSILYSWWILPLLRQASRREVELEEIYSVMPKDSTAYLGSQLAAAWRKELQFQSPSLHRAIFRTFGLQFFFLTLACTISNCLLLAQSVLLGCLVVFFEGESPPEYGYSFAALLILVNHLTVTLAQLSQFGCQRMGMNIRVAVSSLLYDKSLRLSLHSLAGSGIGTAVNMLSNDVNRYDWALYFLPYLVSAPIQLIILTVVIYECVGPTFLAGVGVFVLFIPTQGFIAAAYGKLRANIAKTSDHRLSLLAELINGMQLVKISCWEEPFRLLLSKARQNELKWIRLKWILQALNGGLYVVSGKLVIFLSILLYVFAGNLLTPEKVFVGFSLYKNTMLIITEMFPSAIAKASEVYVSTRRIQEFLLLQEKPVSRANFDPNENETNKGIYIEAVSASWSERGEQPKTLENIQLGVAMKDLLIVNGQVGSGKSSLLQVLMGELEAQSGRVSVMGRIAYAAQDAWIFPGNVKENIIFGSEFEQSWYNQVIDACALRLDIENLPYGDLTLVGYRGVTLSGGQRARVSLARAVYSKADIYLLDDPLSALDTMVAKHIVDNCIKGLLKDKCVLLVTHQLNYFSGDTRVLILDNGQASTSGSMQELPFTLVTSSLEDTTLDALVRNDKTNSTDLSWDQAKKTVYGTFKVPPVEQEIRSIGSVTWRLFAKYLKAGNGYLTIGLLTLFLVGCHFLVYACDYYLIILTDTQQKMAENKADNRDSSWEDGSNLQTYAWLIGSAVLVSVLKDQIFYHVCWSSSRALYKSAFEAILIAPMRFFDENSNGRILNRFSSDTGTIDEAVPVSLYYTVYVILDIVATLIIVFILSPVVILFVVLFLPLLVLLQDTFLNAVFRVKRLEGIARSPVFAHLSSTLEGLNTIRCFQNEQHLTEKFRLAQDAHSSAWFTYVCFSNWCAMTTITLGTALFAVIVLCFILAPGESSSAGLAIALTLTLTTNFYGGVKFMSDLANQIVAVERVIDYSRTLPEAFHKRPSQSVPINWPVRGQVSIDNLVVKYGDTPPVVRGISLSIKHAQKVGIVGRTGAGKSSLIAALFRLVEPTAGQMYIDGLNLNELGLHDARSAISFIPQDPVNFSGTIRKNLDPFEIHDDTELWSALVQVQLADRLLVGEAACGLDSSVSECGVNFSKGERQLICLARSLLSKRKILVLDEATANVDPRTEVIIQETIRKHFQGSTVIIIAHRLETVIELDQIFLMDAGMIIEFGEPICLIDKQGGRFRELVMRTGQKKAEELRLLAHKAHLERISQRNWTTDSLTSNSSKNSKPNSS